MVFLVYKTHEVIYSVIFLTYRFVCFLCGFRRGYCCVNFFPFNSTKFYQIAKFFLLLVIFRRIVKYFVIAAIRYIFLFFLSQCLQCLDTTFSFIFFVSLFFLIHIRIIIILHYLLGLALFVATSTNRLFSAEVYLHWKLAFVCDSEFYALTAFDFFDQITDSCSTQNTILCDHKTQMPINLKISYMCECAYK